MRIRKWTKKLTKKQWDLVINNTGLMYSMANKFHIHPNLQEEFIYDYCYPAMMRAAIGFKPKLGAFSTYACWGLKFAHRSWLRDRGRNHLYTNTIDDTTTTLSLAHPTVVDQHLYEDRELIDKLLDKLPHRTRMVIVLRYMHGWQYAAIGKLLGITRERVRQIAVKGLTAVKSRTRTLPQ